ncbi:MAG: leucine-rich repeat domain-containing protein [Tannerellaceae bacterium]|jgi:hypothetical protein|nr:leucine-rich repeat domain-containing protein [Tannerellaceae bacterium]
MDYNDDNLNPQAEQARTKADDNAAQEPSATELLAKLKPEMDEAMGGRALEQYGFGQWNISETDLKTDCIIVPDGKLYVGDFAFAANWKFVQTVRMPDSVVKIGRAAFLGCSSLSSVTMPNVLTSIEDYAFWGCISLTSVTFPASLTSIGREAFYGCTSLKSVTIPASVTSIGDCAFAACRSLASIRIPRGLAAIGEQAFPPDASIYIV